MGEAATSGPGVLASFGLGGWGSVLGFVWLGLLVLTALFLGFRLLQASRRGAADALARDAERATQALERSSQRMPLLELINRAARKGWDITGKSIEIMDFLQALRQACGDSQIRCWGRPVSNAPLEAMRTELHRPIPAGHWRDFEFDLDTIVAKADNFDTKTCNLRQSKRNAGGYVDIYVDGQAALDWLDDTAPRYHRVTRHPM
ncbi:hypothetical protein [Terrarubrum flagellatum]|uniref:hypothetical protein n=1 Tax=Terrirubrum flagellatum TaxID=2895980 RepID=UPI0031451A63